MRETAITMSRCIVGLLACHGDGVVDQESTPQNITLVPKMLAGHPRSRLHPRAKGQRFYHSFQSTTSKLTSSSGPGPLHAYLEKVAVTSPCINYCFLFAISTLTLLPHPLSHDLTPEVLQQASSCSSIRQQLILNKIL